MATPYSRLLAEVARLAEGDTAAVSASGWYILVSLPGSGARAIVSIHSFALQSGVLLVLAVILATRGWRWRRRVISALAALGAALLLQGLVRVLQVLG